jgi:ankyrin repeat protein
MNTKKPPYPRLGELIRAASVVLETKPKGGAIDRWAREGEYDYSIIKDIMDIVFKTPFSSKDSEFDIRFRDFGERLKLSYIEQVRMVSLAGFDQRQSIPWLLETFVSKEVVELLGPWLADHREVNRDELLLSDKPVVWAFKWLSDKYAFDAYIRSCSETDKVRRWVAGKQPPGMSRLFYHLKKFIASDHVSDRDGDCINELFFISKVLQNIFDDVQSGAFREILSARLKGIYVPKPDIDILMSHLKHEPSLIFNKVAPVIDLVDTIQARITKPNKQDGDQQEIYNLLKQGESLCEQLKEWNPYWWKVGRFRGLWSVFAGEKKEALAFYKQVVEYMFYTGAENLETVFREALVLAAMCDDRPYLKRIKNQGVVFNFFDDPIEAENSVSSKKHKSNVVEDWEVKVWASQFDRYFPSDRFFSGVDSIPQSTDAGGILTLNKGDMLTEPKLRYPNSSVMVQNKKYPQLVYFTQFHRYMGANYIKAVRDLVSRGADVNSLSSSGESALLFAVEHMIPTKPPFEPVRELFDIVSSMEHSKDVLNTPTNKRKKTILGCAVETSSPDVVAKVIEMGALVDQKTDVDQNTPLMKAISMHRLPNIDEFLMLHLQNPTKPFLDSVRRFVPELGGMDINMTHENLMRLLNSSRGAELMHVLTTVVKEQLAESYKVNGQVKVVEALLKAKANPNHADYHGQIWDSYTPLMLAAELDFFDAFKLMMEYGGNPEQVAFYKPMNQFMGCQEIASMYGAKKVYSLL